MKKLILFGATIEDDGTLSILAKDEEKNEIIEFQNCRIVEEPKPLPDNVTEIKDGTFTIGYKYKLPMK